MKIKKLRKPAMLLVLVVMFILMVLSCELPEYMLQFIFTSSTWNDITGLCEYNIEVTNVGFEDLYNVQVEVVLNTTGGEYTEWYYCGDLSVGEYYENPISPATFTYSGNFTALNFRQAGWDIE